MLDDRDKGQERESCSDMIVTPQGKEETMKASDAAIRIQSLYRAKAARGAVAEKRMQHRQEGAAAVRIQSMYRGKAARGAIEERRMQHRRREQEQGAAAIRVQSIWRGKAARSMYR